MARAVARWLEEVCVTRLPTIDLFAGAGGLSIGAANAGCDVRVLVDFDHVACQTLLANADHHPGRVVESDVGDLDGAALRDLGSIGSGQPLLVVGGPPCQPFSKAAFWSEDGDDAAYRRARAEGRRAPRPQAHGPREDHRSVLIDEYLRLAIESGADGFLFENVPSLAAPRNRPMLEAFVRRAESNGYHATLLRANAVDYGVAQRRERVFVLAAKERRPIAPKPTHTLHPNRFPDLRPAATCKSVLSPYGSRKFSEPEEIVTGRWEEHLRTVPPGGNYKAHTAWGGHPRPTFVTETRFWNFLLKLSPDLPSWTIPANPGPWTGPFHWDSRRLRTPELAALQGFPDGYVFAGSRRERVRQIGNAAPAPLASAMTRAVVAAILGHPVEAEPAEVAACAA
jgi:DNA (cytosine-5)-methyltransferase 1